MNAERKSDENNSGDSMDENNRNIRVVKTGGRKVTKTTTEYDWEQVREKNLERT